MNEKGKMIRDALLVVDALAVFDVDEPEFDKDRLDELYKLIRKAKQLKRSRLWVLR